MSIHELAAKKNKWIHIDKVTDEVAEYLKENFKFHPLDIEDVVSDRQRPKIDSYKYYLFTIFVFPYFDKTKRKIRGREVDVFISQDTLITISKKPYPLLTELFDKTSQSAKLQKMWLDKSPAFLLYKILESLFRDANASVDYVGKQISEIEDDVYSQNLRNVVGDLAFIRRGILALRRILDPQRFTINTLSHTNRDFISTDMVYYFDNIHDYVEKMWVVVENFRDTVDGLHLTNESLISQHTNRIIKILTVISVGLMPFTVLSGVYGMNISLPFQQQPFAIWLMFGGLALFIIFAITLIYRKGRF